MKWKIAALAMGLGFGPVAVAQNYTASFIADLFAEKDQSSGVIVTEERKEQLLQMVRRTAEQCHNNLERGKEAENIANMVVFTHQKLEDVQIYITHYDLLDVVYSTLGDGQKDWNCASILAMYLVLRTPDNGEPGVTHINAYKAIQAGRDIGILGPK